MVGTSGRAVLRLGPVKPIACSLPALICGMAISGLMMNDCTSPLITAVTACPVPL